ncbi:MAG TPA: hypothetical protein DCL00_01815 [Opitutae bacterium]|nr:hypothetical protein [Opitutae bacterium]
MISSKLQTKRSGQTRFFGEIAESCSRELECLGFLAEVFLIPGGVGIRFLSDRQFCNLADLAHLPIKELDFSRVSSFDPEKIQDFPIEAISLPLGCAFPLREFKLFPLRRFSAEKCQATDFESLAILSIEELNLSGSAVEQLTFTHSMPLTKLDISQTNVLDLRPLAEKPLEKLNLQHTKVDNLSPLSACPLTEINLNKTGIENLEPLRARPLIEVELRKTRVEDLSPLMESPLERLSLPGSPIRSLNPLTFCPIKFLNMIGLQSVDLSPLKEMQLHTLCISPLELKSEDFSLLQELNLPQLVGPGDDPRQTTDQFVQKYNQSNE